MSELGAVGQGQGHRNAHIDANIRALVHLGLGVQSLDAEADMPAERVLDELLRAGGIVIASGTETIEPTVTTAEEAAELGVPVHMPAFLFERITRDENGRPLEYVRSVYRGDRYRLELDLRPPTH